MLLKFILNAQRGNVSILSLYHTQNTTQISPIKNTKFPSFLICFMFGFICNESGLLILRLQTYDKGYNFEDT